MFIIKQTEPNLWTIGSMSPEWEPHRDCDSLEEAERLCTHLNGADIIVTPIEIWELLIDIVFPRRGTEAELYILDPRLVKRAEDIIIKLKLV